MSGRSAKQLRRRIWGLERRVEQREGGRVKVAGVHEPRRYARGPQRGWWSTQIVAIGPRADYQQAKRGRPGGGRC